MGFNILYNNTYSAIEDLVGLSGASGYSFDLSDYGYFTSAGPFALGDSGRFGGLWGERTYILDGFYTHGEDAQNIPFADKSTVTSNNLSTTVMVNVYSVKSSKIVTGTANSRDFRYNNGYLEHRQPTVGTWEKYSESKVKKNIVFGACGKGGNGGTGNSVGDNEAGGGGGAGGELKLYIRLSNLDYISITQASAGTVTLKGYKNSSHVFTYTVNPGANGGNGATNAAGAGGSGGTVSFSGTLPTKTVYEVYNKTGKSGASGIEVSDPVFGSPDSVAYGGSGGGNTTIIGLTYGDGGHGESVSTSDGHYGRTDGEAAFWGIVAENLDSGEIITGAFV